MKRLITTADDFGWSRDVNEAVVRGYRDGLLRYASLMVRGEAARDAARLARENPGLGLGLHLELCRDSPASWGLRYFLDPRHRARVAPEIEAQFDAFFALTGRTPTHVDGHFNIHVHPVIFPLLARAARRRGVPRIRLPGGEALLAASHELKAGGGAPAALGRLALAGVFGSLGLALRPAARGLTVPDRTWGLLRSGLMGEAYFASLLEALPEGLTEIYFHPACDPGTEVTDRPTPLHHSLTELKSLLSRRASEALKRSGAALETAGPGA